MEKEFHVGKYSQPRKRFNLYSIKKLAVNLGIQNKSLRENQVLHQTENLNNETICITGVLIQNC